MPPPPHEEIVDEWLSEVTALADELDELILFESADQLRPHVHALRRQLAAIERARRRRLPDLPLEETVWLAQFVAAAKDAAHAFDIDDLVREFVVEEEWNQLAQRDALDRSEAANQKRQAALATAVERRRAERAARIDALRPEFDRLRQQGHSAKRACELLAAQAGGDAEIIRRRAETLRKWFGGS